MSFKALSVFLFLLLTFQLNVFSQVQWANRVLSFSSQKGNQSYSAKQALGLPSKLPSLGDCGCAWTASNQENFEEEFVRVKFENKIKVQQIFISENYNGGAVKEIYLYDQYNLPHLVYQRTEVTPEYGRLFSITFPLTTFETDDLKLVLDTESVWGENQIDAIGISSEIVTLDFSYIPGNTSIEFKGKAINMGDVINSQGSEVCPLISPDGNRLYYTRKDHPDNTGYVMNDDIWYSELIDDNWTDPQNIGDPINNETNNYVVGISSDGQMLTLANTYIPGGDSKIGVSQTWSHGNDWRYPVNLATPGLLSYNPYVEYYMDESRSYLLVALEKAEGNGLKDIYVSFTENQINWTVPINLGSVINTAGNEMSPFLSPDGTMLFYASNGLPGYGEMDIYVAHRLDDSWTNWSAPENLGPTVNSDGFDAYFTYSDSSNYAFFTSTRENYFNPDIFRIPIKIILEPEAEEEIVAESTNEMNSSSDDLSDIELASDLVLTNDILLFGTIYDALSDEKIDAEVIFMLNDYAADPESIQTLNQNYQKKVTGNLNYKVVIIKEGYFYYEQIIDIADANEKNVKRIDFKLDPITSGEKFILDNMYFNANSAILKSASFAQLDILYDFLAKNKNVRVEVGGHSNGLCDDEYCINLSKERAESVIKYLVGKGIDSSRMTAAGYGKKHPIASNDTPEGRKKNQRVEITIL
ncbi:MAG: PD40 domain-containing protein [Bacteroidetes bacterium]|nr:PD40 domain-containing protein [Bacteroidota bacterium]